MKAACHFSVSALCTALLVMMSVPALAKSADVPAWTPNPSLLPKLDREVHFGTFLFRPPLGSQLTGLVDGMVDPGYGCFTSSPHPNHFAASIQMTYDDNYTIGTRTPDTLCTDMERIQITSQKDLIVSPVEHGTINGLSAIRQKYQYGLPSGLVVSGCYYVVTNTNGCIVVNIGDIKPFSDSTLPLLETSILTIRASKSSVPNGFPFTDSPESKQ